MKVLVTGSRDWEHPETIERAIFHALYETKTAHSDAVLIHGACPTGADAHAARYATTMGMRVLPFPAQWDRWGRSAGFIRNSEMVDLDPDICLAFIRSGSRGASMTAQLAETAGIETRRFLA
ncbi:SLOG family protein [Streptomyces sp. NPDC089922]|uniref:SLOG family protein n=1 Tax=Streptomyces sp. NPDC089922 TaxID=3155189 RepID=UPI003440B2E2